MHAKQFSASVRIRGALALAALILLSGCAGYPYWGGWSQRPTPQQQAKALGQPVPPVAK